MSFDITHFLGEEDGSNTTKFHLGKKLSELMRAQKMFLLEYTYFKDYEKDGGSIINANWMIDILNKLNDTELNDIIIGMYGHIFKKNDLGNIIIDTDGITSTILESKDFTYDQKCAIRDIFNFLVDNEQKSYTLYGYAGTGKTTTIVEIAYYLLTKRLISSVIFSAPTNKAVNVIKGKFRPYLKLLYEQFAKTTCGDDFKFEDILDILLTHDIKIDFTTIHKLLKFKTDFSNDGDRVFIRNGDSIIDKYEFVIVDECSMIPLNIVDSLFEEIRKGKFKSGDNFRKIPKVLFCGDPAQLPPVNEAQSVLFMGENNLIPQETYTKLLSTNSDGFMTSYHVDEFKDRYNTFTLEVLSIKNTTLKTVVRSKIDNVTQVCYQIRRWVNGDIKLPNLQPYLGKRGVNFYKFDDGDKLKTEWFKTCLSQFKSGKNLNIILTWTNKQTDIYNATIRNAVFKKKNLKRFEIGDILMLNDFYNIDNSHDKSSVQKLGNKFYTSEQIKVIDVQVVTKKVGDFNIRLNDTVRKLKDATYIEKKYRPIIEVINQKTIRSYKCWALKVQRLTDDTSHEEDVYSIYVMDESSLKTLSDDKDFTSHYIKKLRKILLAGLKNKIKQIDNHVIKPLWHEWYKIFVDPFADVNYGYSISCHKAQGSNFYNVFVDAHDVFKNSNEDEMKRCFYTAVTRTSNKLYVLF